MPRSLKAGLLFTALALIVSACSKKPEPAPAANPAPPATQAEPAPAVPPAQAAAAAPAPGFDGDWRGESGPDLPISFNIQGNQVTSLSASYMGQSGSCSFNGSISSEGPATIADKSFTAKGKNESHGYVEFTATGSLTSATEASGTLVWKGKSELCGDFNLQYKWTAKKEPAEPVEPIDD
ncbi:MAG TPA: hypothetical protein VJR29_06820 [bacterium]|nr:hypothetical protein [bacterium]